MSNTVTRTLVTMAEARDNDEASPAVMQPLMRGNAGQADRLAHICRAVAAAGLGGSPTPEVPEAGLPKFTPEQFEVLDLMAQGYSNTECADLLHKNVSTVKSHQGNIYGKLAVHSRVEATVQAVRFGILPSPATASGRPKRARTAAVAAIVEAEQAPEAEA